MTDGTGALLRTKRHFKALDGLRGVAALTVVCFHFSEMAIFDYARLWIGSGWLEVDFFFCLSGFVIGYAYDERVRAMGLGEFLKARLIRLHPMVVLGAVLGLLALLLDPFAGHLAYSPGRVALMFFATLLVIPYPAMRERGGNLFPLNAPSWSLFWEYVANVAYALVLIRLPRWALWVLLAVAGVVLCWCGHGAGELYGGWSGKTFWTGGARVAYSFTAGLLVYRMGWTIRSRLGFGTLTVLLLLALLMPYADGGWVRQAFAILIYFPLLIALGAGVTLGPKAERLCSFGGNLSYPLYMSHYAVIWIWGNFYDRTKPDATHLWLMVAAGTIVMVAVGTVVMVGYDEPVRRWLGARRRAGAEKAGAGARR